MSQLDNGPPPLPLWSEPAPILPRVDNHSPLDTRIPNGHTQYNTGLGPIDWTPFAAPPKFVTSPEANPANGGLMVRDEFRRVPPRTSRHAFMSLDPPSSIRLSAFAYSTLVSVEQVIEKHWPLGVSSKSEASESSGVGRAERLTSRYELRGKPWQRKGHQELE